ncbi:LON peptidase substrate-binding domain-containing protein [Sinimarinibacterium thermocellulolyticum]|uniref:LON peptidase substrate-binding domain-containing protein n=1 Tax=Sinimarinibacterium thermocellulolyticum TaxID=3170016 RepID=A0ABV2AAP9_9GAMM
MIAAVLDIPIFPLGTVLFPGSLLPLRIFEQRYVDMTKACLGNDSVFGVCLILDGREAGEPAVPHAVGCTARIVDWDVPAPGLFTLRTRGERVFRIHEREVQRDGLIRARVTLRPPPPPAPVDDAYAGLTQLYERIVEHLGAQVFPQPAQPHDGTWLSYRLADLLDLPLAGKQRLLETEDPRAVQALLWNLLRAQATPGGAA